MFLYSTHDTWQALVVYPISQGRILNAALYAIDYSKENSLQPKPWVAEVNGAELVHLLDGWAEEPRKIIAVSSETSRLTRLQISKLKLFYRLV